MALACIVVLGCSRSSTPAPAPTPHPTPPSVPVDAAPAPSASASAAPGASASASLDLGSSPVPKAELERFAREADALPRGQMQKPPPPDPTRDEAIRKVFGDECVLERTCGSLWGVNCRAEVDGPYYYVHPRPTHLETITTCGGACMGGRCKNCPPKNEGWTCAVY